MKEPYGKGSSESILTSSLAGDTARCRLKRRQRHWRAGLLSFEKPLEQDADSIPRGGRQHDTDLSSQQLQEGCDEKDQFTQFCSRRDNSNGLVASDGAGQGDVHHVVQLLRRKCEIASRNLHFE